MPDPCEHDSASGISQRALDDPAKDMTTTQNELSPTFRNSDGSLYIDDDLAAAIELRRKKRAEARP